MSNVAFTAFSLIVFDNAQIYWDGRYWGAGNLNILDISVSYSERCVENLDMVNVSQ